MFKYDKTKCLSPQFKGYSGCLCSYCQSYVNQRGFPWVVVIHGKMDDFEISVCRENNRHGQISWGWEDKNKIILFVGKCRRRGIWNAMKKSAQAFCDSLNSKGKVEQL